MRAPEGQTARKTKRVNIQSHPSIKKWRALLDSNQWPSASVFVSATGPSDGPRAIGDCWACTGTVPADCPIRRDLDAETTVNETFYRRPEVTAWRVRPIRPLIAANGARTEFIIMH